MEKATQSILAISKDPDLSIELHVVEAWGLTALVLLASLRFGGQSRRNDDKEAEEELWMALDYGCSCLSSCPSV